MHDNNKRNINVGIIFFNIILIILYFSYIINIIYKVIYNFLFICPELIPQINEIYSLDQA